jgi:hypothetical protein
MGEMMLKCEKCGSKECSSTQREGEILCRWCRYARDRPKTLEEWQEQHNHDTNSVDKKDTDGNMFSKVVNMINGDK